MLARCAGDNYFPMVDVLFKQQMQWAGVENCQGRAAADRQARRFYTREVRGLLDGPEASGGCQGRPRPRLEGIRRRIRRRPSSSMAADILERCRLRKCRRSSTRCSDAPASAAGRARFRAPGRKRDEIQAPPPARLQILRRTDRIRHRARADRRRRAEWLRQVEPRRGAALGDGRKLLQEHARVRHGRRHLLGLGDPAVAQHRRGDAVPRQ